MNRIKIKRKSEMWVSNNRVLLGASSKDPGRNPNFDTEETKLLISLWGDPKTQKTLITTHRKHTVIAKLAEQMCEYGYKRSAEEINTRIKNLKCFYNRIRKDIDMGINNGTTWKHFDAMDEIMTRSIFSVRPNEIPKPSLKYQLEVERCEQEENSNLKATSVKGCESLPSNGKIEKENINTTTDNFGDALTERNDTIMHRKENVPMDCTENDDKPIKIKEEDASSDEVVETPLIIPKDEPIDEDEVFHSPVDERINNSEAVTPRLSEYIQISNSNPNSITMTPNCRKLVNGSGLNGSLQTSPTSAVKSGITQSILFSNQANPVSNTGKISLVPTNFLLQQNTPQSQQIQIRQQPQQRIICTQPNAQGNSGIVTSQGAGRMKVLLVNAFQNGKTTNVGTTKDAPYGNPNIITTANIQKTNLSESMGSKNSAETSKQSRTNETPIIKDPGMEMLFSKLIVMQKENNEIQRQRLEIERERLEFEKSIADKFLAALTSLNQVQIPTSSNAAKANESTEQCIKENAHPPDFIDELHNFQLLTPKIEKAD